MNCEVRGNNVGGRGGERGKIGESPVVAHGRGEGDGGS